jgi:imidazolonepropionase
MLLAARQLGEELDVKVVTTFLGAHAVPPELAGQQVHVRV